MARTKKSKKAPLDPSTVSSIAYPGGGRGDGIEVVSVNSVPLFTLDASWNGWVDRETIVAPAGSFFRLRPPADVSDAAIESTRAKIVALGAHVKVERTRRAAVPASKDVKPRRHLREVVQSIAEGAPTPKPYAELTDIEILDRALDESEVRSKVREAFEEMRSMLKSGERPCLSKKQRGWVSDVLDACAPQALNLVSRGFVPRGKEVELAPVLRNLPLKPPGRR